mmetsp:Transcript_3167/g.9884  ORF Transcript_3167/g.9884 Transcript_3167/m.9884 type:complete len:145 (+) Transcript_3167:213-647(+)
MMQLGVARHTRLCHQNMCVRLGYLVSTRAGMGGLMLQCAGRCSCRPVKSSFLRHALPFPRLEGDAYRMKDFGLHSNETVTMTAHTVFIATLHNASSAAAAPAPQLPPCHLAIRHIASARSANPGESRVRIDSLALAQARVGEGW